MYEDGLSDAAAMIQAEDNVDELELGRVSN
jgi:hypothetical protein